MMDCKPCETDIFCGTSSIVGDDCVITNYVEEQLLLNGAPLLVYKMLGVNEQGKLLDLAGNGNAISSGEYVAYPAMNAFTNDCTEWRSTHRGANVRYAHLGYDFGPITRNVPNNAPNRVKYPHDTKKEHSVGTILIQQHPESKHRATRIRIEQSRDGVNWIGVDVKTIPDSAELHTFSIKQAHPTRYWRITPISFNGGDGDWWGVVRLIFTDYVPTNLTNVSVDPVFLENRARRYSPDPLRMACTYTVQEPSTFMQAMGFGLDLTMEYQIKVPFSMISRILKRPIVIGDVLELPSETQYDIQMRPISRLLEVNDVTWAADGFTPGWTPTIVAITAKPLIASEETVDIVGDLNALKNGREYTGKEMDLMGLVGSELLRSESNASLPSRGVDNSPIHDFSDSEIQIASEHQVPLRKLNTSQTGIGYEDAIPPNGMKYSESDTLPKTGVDGDWHRVVYPNTDIPARLYQYDGKLQRWMLREEDRKTRHNFIQTKQQQFLSKQE